LELVGDDNTHSGLEQTMAEEHVLKFEHKFICAGDCMEVTPMILLITMTKTIKLLLPRRRVVEIGCKLGEFGGWGVGTSGGFTNWFLLNSFVHTPYHLCTRILCNHLNRHVFGIELKSAFTRPSIPGSLHIHAALEGGVPRGRKKKDIPQCY